jgi:hypothetical protein
VTASFGATRTRLGICATRSSLHLVPSGRGLLGSLTGLGGAIVVVPMLTIVFYNVRIGIFLEVATTVAVTHDQPA